MSDDKHANRIERDLHIDRELDEAHPLCARAIYERRARLQAAGDLMLATEGSYPDKDHIDEVSK